MENIISHKFNGGKHYFKYNVKKVITEHYGEDRFESSGVYTTNGSIGSPIYEEHHEGITYTDKFEREYMICPICEEKVLIKNKLKNSVIKRDSRGSGSCYTGDSCNC